MTIIISYSPDCSISLRLGHIHGCLIYCFDRDRDGRRGEPSRAGDLAAVVAATGDRERDDL
jgi:hypothetical protein